MTKPQQNRVANGIIWSAVERFSVQGVQFLLSIVIARLISPSDYGLIAMLGIFLAVAQQFIDSGFSNALVQKKDRSDVDFSTVFYSNLAIAAVVYAALYAAAPWIADFYSEPKLTPVTRWIGLTVVLMAFSIVQRAKLTIELDFKIQAKLSFVSVTASGLCGVVLAWQGYGVWALVVQTLANNFLNSLLLWIFARWRLRPVFSWTSFRSLFSFGSKLLAVGILHVLYSNVYTLIIGKKFSASDVGYFNRAQTLAMFPSVNISSIITRALYPAQCSIQDDEETLKQSFLDSLRTSAFVIFPLMVGLSILAEPLIRIVLTEKWIDSVKILSILCIAYLPYPLMALNWQLVNVKGRSGLALKSELWGKSIAFVILVTTLPWGLIAICWGMVASGVIDLVVMIHYVKKVMPIGYMQQLRHLTPVISLSAGTALAMLSCKIIVSSAWAQLILCTTAGLICYLGGATLFRFHEVNEAKNWIKRKSAQ